MIDNFDNIKPLLEWRTEDDFYFLQILQRKKDHYDRKVNGSNNNSRLIKAYYVKSLEHFEFIKPEIIELCKVFGARAGINLNRRSFKMMSLQLLKKVTDQIMNGSYNKTYKAYSSVCGVHSNETDKRWIVDFDEKLNQSLIESYKSFINNLQPKGDKFVALIPSKNGFHLITKPFNVEFFKRDFPKIEVHKNNPTNLYIP